MTLSQNTKNKLNLYEEYDFLGMKLFSYSYENCHNRDILVDLRKNKKYILANICNALNCESDILRGNKQQMLEWLSKQ